MPDPTGLSTGLLPWFVGHGLQKLFDELYRELQLVRKYKTECQLFVEQLTLFWILYEEIKSNLEKNPSNSHVIEAWFQDVKKCLDDSQALVTSFQKQNLSLWERRNFGQSILTRRDDLQKLIGDQVRLSLLFEINNNVQETAKTVQETVTNIQETTKTVQETSKTVQETATNVEELGKQLNELTEGMQIFMSSPSGNPEAIVAKLSSIQSLNKRSASTSSSSAPSFSLKHEEPVFGREAVIEELETLLLDQCGPKIVALHGSGGTGKTHIARALIRRPALQSHFESLWITLGLKSESTNSDLLQKMEKEIRSIVNNEGKSQTKFLIVLDDIWEMKDLTYLPKFVEGISQQLPKFVEGISQQLEFRFLITTRNKKMIEACNKTVRPVPIKVLLERESWDLFRYYAFPDHQEEDIPSALSAIAKEITIKCGGLPLALKVVGRAMSDKRTENEWDDALNDLHEKKVIGKNHDVELFQVLQVSYNALESKEENMGKLRKYFLYFGVFAEDEEIHVTSLMNCWVGEGLLQGGKDPLDQTYIVLAVLIGYSLVEKIPNKTERCKIHDVLRDLTFHISKKERPQEDLFQPAIRHRENLVDDKIVRISWRHTKFLDAQIVAPNLKVLLLDYSEITKNCLDGAFQSLSSLQVLSLQGTSIKYLPDSLGRLCCLVVLNLAMCYYIENLPHSFGNLTKLKVLNLTNCLKFKIFPELLHLKDIQVLKLPLLEDIQKRDYYDDEPVIKYWFVLSGELEKESLELTSTALTWLTFSSVKLVHLNTGSMSRLTILHMDCPINDIEPLKRLSKLKDLRMYKTVLRSLPDWICQFKFLNRLEIYTTNQKADYLPALDTLSRLRTLVISGWKSLTSFPKCPPSLEKLLINDCECLEGFSNVVFDSLRQLYVWGNRKLSLKNLRRLPKLEDLHISGPTKAMNIRILENNYAQLDIEELPEMPQIIRFFMDVLNSELKKQIQFQVSSLCNLQGLYLRSYGIKFPEITGEGAFQNLRMLDLICNSIEFPVVPKEALPALIHLKLHMWRCNKIPDSLWHLLDGSPNLSILTLDGRDITIFDEWGSIHMPKNLIMEYFKVKKLPSLCFEQLKYLRLAYLKELEEHPTTLPNVCVHLDGCPKLPESVQPRIELFNHARHTRWKVRADGGLEKVRKSFESSAI